MYLSCTVYEIFGFDIVREIGIHDRENQGILFCPTCGNPEEENIMIVRN